MSPAALALYALLLDRGSCQIWPRDPAGEDASLFCTALIEDGGGLNGGKAYYAMGAYTLAREPRRLVLHRVTRRSSSRGGEMEEARHVVLDGAGGVREAARVWASVPVDSPCPDCRPSVPMGPEDVRRELERAEDLIQRHVYFGRPLRTP